MDQCGQIREGYADLDNDVEVMGLVLVKLPISMKLEDRYRVALEERTYDCFIIDIATKDRQNYRRIEQVAACRRRLITFDLRHILEEKDSRYSHDLNRLIHSQR